MDVNWLDCQLWGFLAYSNNQWDLLNIHQIHCVKVNLQVYEGPDRRGFLMAEGQSSQNTLKC